MSWKVQKRKEPSCKLILFLSDTMEEQKGKRARFLNLAVQKKKYCSSIEHGNGFFSMNKINKLEEGKYLLEALF